MSLFKTQEFWNTKCGLNEEFDQLSLHVANIDNSPDGSDKLIVGSHSGFLRIFTLNGRTPLNNKDTYLNLEKLNFDRNDLLLEMKFEMPILQVNSGVLLSVNDKKQLVLLFPKKMSVFNVANTEGVAEHGFAYNIVTLYEHELVRSAFCLTVGSFGQVKGRDFVCVQSLDCCLMFFEQETASFVHTLSNSLLPTLFTYLPINDTFIVQTADWSLQCYRYQMLAISAQQQDEWTFDLSEPVLQIDAICYEKNTTSLIVVLSECNLTFLNVDGTRFWQKKFDFRPLSCLSYVSSKGTPVQVFTTTSSKTNNALNQTQALLQRDLVTLVITEMQTLLIYNEQQLKWACKLPIQYIKVCRSSFYFSSTYFIEGCLVFLAYDGQISLAYLGTNPSGNVVNRVNANLSARNKKNYFKLNQNSLLEQQIINELHVLDKQEIDKEYSELKKFINIHDSQLDSLFEANSLNSKSSLQNEHHFKLNKTQITLLKQLDEVMLYEINKSNERNSFKSDIKLINLNLELQCLNKKISNLKINLTTSNFFEIKSEKIPNFQNNNIDTRSIELEFELYFYESDFFSSYNHLVYLIVNYLDDQKVGQIYVQNIELPLEYFIKFNFLTAASEHNLSIDQQTLKALNTFNFRFISAINDFNLNLIFQDISKKLIENTSKNTLNTMYDNASQKVNIVFNKIVLEFAFKQHDQIVIELDQTEQPNKSKEPNNQPTSDKIENEFCLKITGLDFHLVCLTANLILNEFKKLEQQNKIDNVALERSFLSLEKYFSYIKCHLAIEQEIDFKCELLTDYCERLRIIEKNFLIKLKEHNTCSSLSYFEYLLSFQYEKIKTCTNELIDLKKKMHVKSEELNCCNILITSFLNKMGNFKKEQTLILEGAFNVLPFVQQNDLQNWSKKTELALNYLLKIPASNKNVNLDIKPNSCDLFDLIKLLVEHVFKGTLFAKVTNQNAKVHFDKQPILEDKEF